MQPLKLEEMSLQTLEKVRNKWTNAEEKSLHELWATCTMCTETDEMTNKEYNCNLRIICDMCTDDECEQAQTDDRTCKVCPLNNPDMQFCNSYNTSLIFPDSAKNPNWVENKNRMITEINKAIDKKAER